MYNMYRGQSESTTQLDDTAALGLLNHLESTQLQDLLNNDSKLTDLIRDTPQMKNLETEKENLLTSNKSLADYNLTQEPRLKQAKQELSQAYLQAVELQKIFERHRQDIDCRSVGHQSLSGTLAVLQTEAAKADEESEKTAANFIAHKMEVEEFIPLYLDQRVLAHQRRVKVEKMEQLIQHRTASSYNNSATPLRASSTQYYTVPPHYPAPYSMGIPTPYPTGPSSMPMPTKL